jgi:hypothetical protein
MPAVIAAQAVVTVVVGWSEWPSVFKHLLKQSASGRQINVEVCGFVTTMQHLSFDPCISVEPLNQLCTKSAVAQRLRRRMCGEATPRRRQF